MRYACPQTKYFCGIDLHTQKLFVCIIDSTGAIVYHKEISCGEKELTEVLMPYHGEISIGVESTFNWYWVADLCQKHGFELYLGHALYLKHIHGGKNKNDRLDSRKLAHLLRTGFFPLAYAYPEKMRAARDLFRMRHALVHLRSAQCARIKGFLYQQGTTDFPDNILNVKSTRNAVVQKFTHHETAVVAEKELCLIDQLEKAIKCLETEAVTSATSHDPQSYDLLLSIPGVGTALALTILYEMHTIQRFGTASRFSSYCRVVRVEHSSAGKAQYPNNVKIGNPNLQWAFGQVAVHSMRCSGAIRAYYNKLLKKYGKARALSRLSHKFCVTVFYMLKNKTKFDETQFISGLANYKSLVNTGRTLSSSPRS